MKFPILGPQQNQGQRSKCGLASSPQPELLKSSNAHQDLFSFQTSSNIFHSYKHFAKSPRSPPSRSFNKNALCTLKGVLVIKFYMQKELFFLLQKEKVLQRPSEERQKCREKSMTESSWALKSGGKSNLGQLSTLGLWSSTNPQGRPWFSIPSQHS